MMEVALTWNLVLLSGFVMLFAYSFLLGQNSTIKLILSIYIAIMTADGIAKILQDFVINPSPGFRELIGTQQDEVFAWLRIILFLAAVITFVVKSGFHIALEKHDHWAARLGIHAIFSGLSAMLFLSTILIYISGNSFVEGMMFAKDISIYKESLLAQVLIDNYQIWFSLPAMAFLATSFLFENEVPD